jgi:hypothetical protein
LSEEKQLVAIINAGPVKGVPNLERESKFALKAKTFSTGSRGFYTNGRMEIDFESYTVTVMLVKVGSKPKEVKPLA